MAQSYKLKINISYKIKFRSISVSDLPIRQNKILKCFSITPNYLRSTNKNNISPEWNTHQKSEEFIFGKKSLIITLPQLTTRLHGYSTNLHHLLLLLL